MDIAVRADGAENPDERRAALDVAAVYKSALPRLLRIAAGMGLTPPDAEDALHDAYVALLQNRGKLSDAADAERWITRVTVNRCYLHHRHRKRRQKRMPGPATEPEALSPDDDRAIVRQALRELDDDVLAVLVLRYFCELNAADIGKILEVPPATVRGWLRRGRLKLAEWLIEKGFTDDAS
jgi:RNA polymerase sigma-70 factor (ECF subfamily)